MNTRDLGIQYNLVTKACLLVEYWCTENGISLPLIKSFDISTNDPLLSAYHGLSTCGFYRPSLRGTEDKNVICVMVDKCTLPGRGYSWPAHVSDRTPYGVIAHELGHHADWYMGQPAGGIRKEVKEPMLSSYGSGDHEWFAEMFRLFFTNPPLLKILRPKTYEALLYTFPVLTTRNTRWEAVLEATNAPARIRHAVKERIARDTKGKATNV